MNARFQRLKSVFDSLKVRVTLGGILMLVLGIGAITVLLVSRAEHDLLRTARTRETDESAHTAALLSRRVLDLQHALQTVTRQLDHPTLSSDAALFAFFRNQPLMLNFFSDILVTAPDGKILMFVDEKGTRRLSVNLGDRPYLRQSLSEARPVISEPFPSRISDAIVLVFTQPLRDIGGIYGVLVGSLRLANRTLLEGLSDPRDADTDALTIVTDINGRIMAHPDATRLMQPLSREPRMAQAFAAWKEMGRPAEQMGLILPQDGEVISAATVPGPDWMVWRARSEAHLFAPVRDARKAALKWATLVIALLSTLLLAYLWWLLRPLTQLERRAERMFDKNLDPKAGWPSARGEIAQLGQVLRRVGAERVQMETLSSETFGKLSSVMSAAPLGIAFTRELHFELVNHEFCRLVGHDETDLLGRSVQLIFASVADHGTLTHHEHAAFGSGRPYLGEWQITRKDGTRRWVRLHSKPVAAHDLGKGMIWTLADIHDQHAEREQLRWFASHDPLTGLANRMVFNRRVEHILESLPRSDDAVLLFIDLDGFKLVNDTAGHVAGDVMLKTVSRAITSQARPGDLVVRFGGDEFALLLEHGGAEAALRTARDVGRAIRSIALPWGEHTLKVGASIGLASLQPGMKTATAWLSSADAAAYAAKMAGGHTICIAGTAPSETETVGIEKPVAS
ncbi:MAG: hypothetical protein JWQ03_2596 [Variovorax sp.]|nr:hypothetical protein [Variovorax sp.]